MLISKELCHITANAYIDAIVKLFDIMVLCCQRIFHRCWRSLDVIVGSLDKLVERFNHKRGRISKIGYGRMGRIGKIGGFLVLRWVS